MLTISRVEAHQWKHRNLADCLADAATERRPRAAPALSLLRNAAQIDPQLLSPVRHRSAQAQLHLTEIRARAELVRARTALVNSTRGLAKSYGERLRKCGTQQVGRDLAMGLSAELRAALEPLLREIESLNEHIKEYDRRVEKMAKEGAVAHLPLL